MNQLKNNTVVFSVNASKSNYCFWDKHEFSGKVIQCPISFKPKQVIRKKKEYQLNYGISKTENIPENIYKIIDDKIEYDDCFCSKECCLAWIIDNINVPRYIHSKQIFMNEIANEEEIQKAPHWRLLKKFGGFLSIENFRKGNVTYEKIETIYDGESQSFITNYKEGNKCV